MIIAVDFDGTLVKEDYPRIGEEIPFAVDVLKKFMSLGHKIILHTCRTHVLYDGHDTLSEAVDWCKSRGIQLYAVNDNPQARELYGGQTKVGADLYIDDHGLGIPKVDGHVDWISIQQRVLSSCINTCDLIIDSDNNCE